MSNRLRRVWDAMCELRLHLGLGRAAEPPVRLRLETPRPQPLPGFRKIHAEVPGVFDPRCGRVIEFWATGFEGDEARLVERYLEFTVKVTA